VAAASVEEGVTSATQPLLPPSAPCSAAFVTHQLDHITLGDRENPLLESNGSGLAINDLDNDGLLDIVLANLDDPNTILWNEGRLQFRSEPLPHGDSRGVAIVDVDGDGWQDILFTRRRLASPILWRNLRGGGAPSFEQSEPLGDFGGYSLAWADLDGDNDLDLVTAAYDIEQEKLEGAQPLLRGQGVIYYENQGDHFAPTQLIELAQALAILLIDLNDDQRLDILIGNDFFHPDLLWLRTDEGWDLERLFATTSQNTMSLDAGDLDNDGQMEIFAADMKPYPDEPMQPWVVMMDNMVHDPFKNDPQTMANVLQVRTASGEFQEEAVNRGVDGTGWSWSSKFGDLNNDGFLDLYVVNGMVDPKLFGELPGYELIEENQAFRNDGAGRFLPAPEWGLNATTGGRSMSMADLDNDGDLDLVVNNYLSNAQLFENRSCNGGGLAVDLLWPNSGNTRAIGAQLTLHTSTGVYRREVRSVSGYLSGDPARVHFGLPTGSTPTRLEIIWPDGLLSHIEEIAPQSLVTIFRS
jgi:hypothetical protein